MKAHQIVRRKIFLPEASSCPAWSNLFSFLFFYSISQIGPHLLSLVFNMKGNAEADNKAVYCTASWYWSLIKKKQMWRWKGKENRQGAIFLCWIVLFDLECSEKRALCNVFSTHMANCVTAKHTGGSGSGVGGVLWQKGGGRQTRRKEIGATEDSSGWPWEEKHGCSYWCWVTFPIKAAQSSSCNVGPNKPHNETWECPLVMVQTSICCSVPKTHCLSTHAFCLLWREEIWIIIWGRDLAGKVQSLANEKYY